MSDYRLDIPTIARQTMALRYRFRFLTHVQRERTALTLERIIEKGNYGRGRWSPETVRDLTDIIVALRAEQSEEGKP
jgi:hypothetical protein